MLYCNTASFLLILITIIPATISSRYTLNIVFFENYLISIKEIDTLMIHSKNKEGHS